MTITLTSAQFKRTRIAPTPSGFLHLGNILSFAVTAAIARDTGAKILLRIDDLDQARVNPEYVQDIFDTLNFLNIPWDEGPRNAEEFKSAYRQIHRMDNYKAVLDELQGKRLVFACTCSRQQINNGAGCICYEKQLSLTAENTCWRLVTEQETELELKDINKGIIKSVLPSGMQNFGVKKKDGFPAYQLTSLVDDLFYGVDLIVRGQDLWASTLAQLKLANVTGRGNIFGATTFYHHPLIMETPQKKLSKSAGAASIKYLRENGNSAAAIFGLAARMATIELPVNNWEQLGAAIINHL